MEVLARSLADGGTEGLLAAYDAYADRLYAYSSLLLADQDADATDAADAVYDAFLVAAERAATLREASRLGPWLYALTRNECLRRRPGRAAGGQRWEPVELAVRHGLTAEDIAAVLGIEQAETAAVLAARPDCLDPLPAHVAPAELRERLAAAAVGGPLDGPTSAHRTELAGRAGPFRADGFPQPIDRRRLSGRVLAVSIAVVVVGTLAVLTGVPSGRTGAAGGASGEQPDLAVAAVPAGRPLAQPSSWPAPRPAPATSLRPTEPTSPASSAASAAHATTPAPTTLLVGGSASDLAVYGWLENRTAPYCPRRWTARVHVTVTGGDAQQVVASWFDGAGVRTVTLRQEDRAWVGELGGIPVGKQLWWRAGVTAEDGATASAGEQPLVYSCGR